MNQRYTAANMLLCIIITFTLIICLHGTPKTANATLVELVPVADASLWEIAPNTNYNNDWLRAKTTPDPTSMELSKRIVILFDLSSIPPGSRINYATLWLYVEWMDSGGTYPRQFVTYRLTEDWTETGVCWNRRGGGKGTWTDSGGTFVTSGASSKNIDYHGDFWEHWDVNAIVNDWTQGAPNYGFLIKILDEGVGIDEGINCYSRDYSDYSLRPYLVVDWDPPPPSLTIDHYGSPISSLAITPCTNFIVAISTRDIPSGYVLTHFDCNLYWDPSLMEVIDVQELASGRSLPNSLDEYNDEIFFAVTVSNTGGSWATEDTEWLIITFHCLGVGQSDITVRSEAGTLRIWDQIYEWAEYYPEYAISCNQYGRIISTTSSVVGGFYIPVNSFAVLLPYLALAIMIFVVSAVLVKRNRCKA